MFVGHLCGYSVDPWTDFSRGHFLPAKIEPTQVDGVQYPRIFDWRISVYSWLGRIRAIVIRIHYICMLILCRNFAGEEDGPQITQPPSRGAEY